MRDIKSKRDFSVNLELIIIYTRMVQVFCEKNDLEFKSIQSEHYLEELIDIGVICDKNELNDFVKLCEGKYSEFETAVNFVINNRALIGNLLDKIYKVRRKELQKIKQTDNKLTLVDFFSGAGGLSLGFIQEGFNVKLANDIEDVCIQTYRYNHPDLPTDKVVQGDIKEIVCNIEEYIDTDIDIIVGGPPCQGFSEANRQRVIDDPRNMLYKYFIEAVKTIAPKFVVMENVKGMLKVAGQVCDDYSNIKIKKNGADYAYKTAFNVLNSEEFSVAQKRERLIYIAVRNDVIAEMDITPEQIFEQISKANENSKRYILNDALLDIKELDAPRIKNTNEIDSEISGKKIDINRFQNHENEYLDLINLNNKMPMVLNHKARYCNDINYEIYSKLAQGEDATSEKIKHVMPYSHRNHCFKDKYYKLRADKPCRTITAHLKMDCHSHIHPFQSRAITPREAARIQSFPDDYLFCGAYLKTYMQIGNAVPPLMSRGIAKVIKKYL
ncbi:MAG: DNA cytosine methyltransferase [Eubacteriales bacterium]